MTARQFDIEHTRLNGHQQLVIGAGSLHPKRIFPPAGEKYAFDVPQWKRRVTVNVSPTGRSVRVFVDGVEIGGQR